MSPFTGVRWAPPPAGEWVEAEGPLDLCRNGVHACLPAALPLWLSDELWEVEVAGDVERHGDLLLARRARLRRQVEEWTAETRREFALACAAHAAEAGGDDLARAYAADARRSVDQETGFHAAVEAAYVAARAAEAREPGGRRREVAWQAGWLARRLALPEPA